MKAAVKTADDVLEVTDVTFRELGPHDVEVQIEASGVCQSDLSLLSGKIPMPPPSILGHEGAGRVIAVGSDVTRVKVGDRVIGSFIPTCGNCWYCTHDLSQHCSRALKVQFEHHCHLHDGTPVMSASGLGTFAETSRMHEWAAIKVDTDLPSEILALIGCGVTTGTGAALNTAQVTPGSTVAVLGCGGVGQFVLQGARIAGAARIIAVDPAADKRAAALAIGATDVVDPNEAPIPDQLKALTKGRGVDYCFEVVGQPALVRAAYDSVRAAGTAVIVGMPGFDAEVSLPMFDWFYTEKRVVGCTYGSARVRRDFQRLVDLCESGQLDIGAAISARFPLDQVNDAVAALKAGEVIRSVLIP